ncbi:MAG TPA: carbamoyl-phosphate synthase small subunit [Candidatus Omnitrophica bacterium]|nr:carbamoyl-phosphate synthase small subunit [Candidatus Omnitrophota bacterium]
MKAILVLEDGSYFEGRAFGYPGEKLGEVVFNTSITGYQEILTDPSYKGQIVCMTYPHIGNYGVNSEDIESAHPQVEGFVVRELSPLVSNWRAEEDLHSYLEKYKITGIEGIDTRELTRKIRIKGAMRGGISSVDLNPQSLLERVLQSPQMVGRNLACEVSCTQPYYFQEEGEVEIAVWDCGVKRSILQMLAKNNCRVKVYPVHSSGEDILKDKPQGLLVSNGPGDPAAVIHVITELKKLLGKLPIFGICLGHQILGLALGGKTYKLKFGHHGGNHPVKDLNTGKIDITAQNHGFCVDPDSISDCCHITHINLYDKTLEGFRHKKMPIMAVQYHPEAGPGPNDAKHIFKEFIDLVKKNA